MNYFDRVPVWFRPAVEAARMLIPPLVAQTIEPRFLCGISPRYVGLHYGDMAKNWPDVAAKGLTYDDVAHACYAHNTPDEKPTIVFPNLRVYSDPIGTLLHEYGHLFDEATGFHLTAPVTTEYSRSNRVERIAEAFELILRPPTGEWEAYVECEEMRPLRQEMGLA